MWLVISPYSQHTASDFVRIIRRNRRLPQYLRQAFEVSPSAPSSIKVTNPEAPRGASVPDWFRELHMASFMNEWVITTGELRLDDPAPGQNRTVPDTGGDGSYEPGYYVKARWGSSRAAPDSDVVLGHTYPSDCDAQSSDCVGPRRSLSWGGCRDARVATVNECSIPLVQGIGAAGCGLVVIANRLPTRDGRTAGVPDNFFVNTFLHELGVHAGPFSNPETVSPQHGGREADRRAEQSTVMGPRTAEPAHAPTHPR
jgi:hypothetical protein